MQSIMSNDKMETGSKILLVDDEPGNIEMLIEALESEHEVIVAISGERALRLAATVPQPDLILLDVIMPGLDGYEVCRRLKADPSTAAIPIVFLSASSDAGAVRQGLALGAADYLTKPFALHEVQACVQKQLAQHRRE